MAQIPGQCSPKELHHLFGNPLAVYRKPNGILVVKNVVSPYLIGLRVPMCEVIGLAFVNAFSAKSHSESPFCNWFGKDLHLTWNTPLSVISVILRRSILALLAQCLPILTTNHICECVSSLLLSNSGIRFAAAMDTRKFQNASAAWLHLYCGLLIFVFTEFAL